MHTFQATNTAAFGQNPNQKVQKSKKTQQIVLKQIWRSRSEPTVKVKKHSGAILPYENYTLRD